MIIKNECIHCNKSTLLDKLEKINCYDKYKNKYTLTYFKCVHCGKKNYVQIDDEQSKNMLKELVDLSVKAYAKSRTGKKISKKMLKKRDALRQKLLLHREILKKNMTAEIIYDENKNILEKGLTFTKEGVIIDSTM